MPEVVVWIDASGTETDLHDGTELLTLAGMNGREMPAWKLLGDEAPLADGSQVRLAKSTSRDLDLPLLVRCQSRAALQQKLRELAWAFNPRRGDGKLRVTSADGIQRVLTCRYIRGLDTEDNGLSWKKVILTLRAFEPYWDAAAETSQNISAGAVSAFFPIFPLLLMVSGLFATATIVNGGDAAAWPIWTIYGPGANPKIINVTSGKRFELGLSLQSNQHVEIDTRPGRKTVTLSTGESVFHLLSAASSLWELEVGSNAVRIELDGNDSNSCVRLRYTERYLSV